MGKRKTDDSDSSEDEAEKSTDISKQSFMKTANLMSKNQPLHKGLNLNHTLVMTQIRHEISSESDSETSKLKPQKQSPVKKLKNEVVSPSESVSSTNEGKTASKKKSKKERKKQSVDLNDNLSYNAFTPRLLPKKDHNAVSDSDDETTSHNTNINDSRRSNQVINDSIKEEDDEELMESIEEKVHKVNILQDITISPKKDLKQLFKDVYPNCKEVNLKTKVKLQDSDEVFLFRIPKNVNPEQLLDINIDLEQGNKINIGEKYTIKSTNKIPYPTLLFDKNSKILHFKGNIVMEKYIKTQKAPSIPIVAKSNVPLPNDLKNRHPLFGSNFEDKLQLDETVEKKLDDAINNILQQNMKVKKKKKKKPKEVVEDDQDIFSFLDNLSGKQNELQQTTNKAPKTKEVEDEQDIFSFLDNLKGKPDKEDKKTPDKPNKKKKMTKNDMIQETLRLMKQELQTEYETDSAVSPSKRKKHKKSKNIAENGIAFNITVKSEDVDNTPNVNSEKKRLSIVNSTLLASTTKLPKFNPDVSQIPNLTEGTEVSLKRKIKKDPQDDPPPKKKRKANLE